jgi:hypothetical protein
MKNYYINIPTWAHSMKIHGVNKKEAIKNFKFKHGMLRMPKGFGIWEIEQC